MRNEVRTPSSPWPPPHPRNLLAPFPISILPGIIEDSRSRLSVIEFVYASGFGGLGVFGGGLPSPLALEPSHVEAGKVGWAGLG